MQRNRIEQTQECTSKPITITTLSFTADSFAEKKTSKATWHTECPKN